MSETAILYFYLQELSTKVERHYFHPILKIILKSQCFHGRKSTKSYFSAQEINVCYWLRCKKTHQKKKGKIKKKRKNPLIKYE